ncbi:MAG TPA: alpha/beta hydrolase [Dehalococcoidia bacterium]|nr:alpha/beta hydrolase [Dehalococcoidia bacterium]
MAVVAEQVSIYGTEVRLRKAGVGPDLLFLHGAGGGDQWFPVYDQIAEAFTLYAPLHPGWGDTWMPDWLEGIDDLVFHYASFIEDLALQKPVLFGTSLGGWIAVELAIYRPDLVSALVLVDPAGFRPENPDWQLDIFNEAPQELFAKLFADPAKAMAMRPPPEGATIDLMVGQYRGSAALARLMWRRNYDPKLRLRAARIKAPCAVFWGAQDQLFTLEHGKTVARDIPGAELVVIDNAGHVPYLEQPEAFLRAFWAFVKKHNLATTAANLKR